MIELFIYGLILLPRIAIIFICTVLKTHTHINRLSRSKQNWKKQKERRKREKI